LNILITGGAGYIGSVLVPELIKEGHEVKVVDLLWFGNNLPKGTTVIEKGTEDITEEDLKGIDAIIHLAGLSNDPMAEFQPLTNYIVNAAQTAYLAQKAKECKVSRFIYASTCSVYGFTGAEKFSVEDDIPTPQYPYGISKLMAERALLALMDTYFSVIILRKGTIGGFSPRMRYDLVVNTMVKSALKDNKITVKNASLWRPIIDIQDVCEAYKLALKGEAWGIFNILERNYTIKELGLAVADAIEETGKSRPLVEIYERFDMRNYRASGQKARDYLGFDPEFTVKDTVKELVERVNNKEVSDFDNPNYYNIEVMRRL
jgi:nucleoside-diphosphate-sugar epimerase